MGKITTLKKKLDSKNQSSQVYRENILKPVTLTGIIAPWSQVDTDGHATDYKLICASGLEYFIAADMEWRHILGWYCWKEVKVVGLLNIADMTIIPQKVYPKGPAGEIENVIDLAAWQGRKALKKASDKLNELILVPAAVMAAGDRLGFLSNWIFVSTLPHGGLLTAIYLRLVPQICDSRKASPTASR